jgi:hypothetical protein
MVETRREDVYRHFATFLFCPATAANGLAGHFLSFAERPSARYALPGLFRLSLTHQILTILRGLDGIGRHRTGVRIVHDHLRGRPRGLRGLAGLWTAIRFRRPLSGFGALGDLTRLGILFLRGWDGRSDAVQQAYAASTSGRCGLMLGCKVALDIAGEITDSA